MEKRSRHVSSRPEANESAHSSTVRAVRFSRQGPLHAAARFGLLQRVGEGVFWLAGLLILGVRWLARGVVLGLGALGSGLWSGLKLAGRGSASAASSTGRGLSVAASSTGRGLSVAASSTGRGLSVAATSTGRGLAGAVTATGRGTITGGRWLLGAVVGLGVALATGSVKLVQTIVDWCTFRAPPENLPEEEEETEEGETEEGEGEPEEEEESHEMELVESHPHLVALNRPPPERDADLPGEEVPHPAVQELARETGTRRGIGAARFFSHREPPQRVEPRMEAWDEEPAAARGFPQSPREEESDRERSTWPTWSLPRENDPFESAKVAMLDAEEADLPLEELEDQAARLRALRRKMGSEP
ncbi:MAG: hypothetical protein HQL51_12555 [Magnetococcales bacterium]|nr:hypothetical protein [Magnetococcales bacterium]